MEEGQYKTRRANMRVRFATPSSELSPSSSSTPRSASSPVDDFIPSALVVAVAVVFAVVERCNLVVVLPNSTLPSSPALSDNDELGVDASSATTTTPPSSPSSTQADIVPVLCVLCLWSGHCRRRRLLDCRGSLVCSNSMTTTSPPREDASAAEAAAEAAAVEKMVADRTT
jgi:hypothetical protein